MSHICERRVVHCPSREASRYLAAFVAAQRAGGLTAHIELRVPIRVFSDRLPAIELRVFAAFHSLHAVSDPHPTYSISWSSKGVPFPEFAGALAVEQGLNDDCFGLVLSGHYDLPFGRLGALFDAALGRRIAHGSARDFLRSITDQIENARTRNDMVRSGANP